MHYLSNRTKLSAFLLAGISACTAAYAHSQNAAPTTAAPPPTTAKARLTVDATKPGIKVSPLLYGIFFEEINHAGDGGLYAELVRNRSLEDNRDKPEFWSVVPGSGAATLGLDAAKPLNDASPHALRLDITRTAAGNNRAGNGGVGVANEGYWGIPVKNGDTYRFSFWARRSDSADSAVTIALESADGKSRYAEARVSGIESGWKRFNGSFKAKGADASARLVVRSAKVGTLWLDVVSLFPGNTWKGRPNGLRPDLAQRVADMKPSFVRFPGGCFVEGDTLANAFRWKETIGDISIRPGRPNLWGYRSTDGLGFHEYLQFSEDLGAEPLYVINCGMSHKGNAPMDQLDTYIQDALDAVEYANGPVTSRWGALRAKNGHPKPFNLKFLQIGNENGGPAYDERYARFHDAMKARYPEVNLIANVWGGVPRSRPLEIIDEHYYNTPRYFASRAYQYDSYDRKGPKIYVGEYAATRGGVGQGNLIGALGEAAYMTGLERNSDIVVMASYAPLFVHVNDRKWNPDAIAFNGTSSYGTPSYYVQKLFRQNQGDTVLSSKVESGIEPPDTRGGIGVATWKTDAEFKDVKVTQGDKTLLTADLAAGSPGWRVVSGDWKVQEGAFRQRSLSENLRAVAGDANWSGDMTYTLKARKKAGDEGFLIMFRARDNENFLWWNIGGWGNTRHAIEKSVDGQNTELGRSVNGRIETNRWYDIRIETRGDRILCYLDGKLIHDVVDRAPQSLTAVVSRKDSDKAIFLKVVNFSAKSQETAVNLNGIGKVAASGEATVLTSARPTDENSLAEPTKVVPVVKKVNGLGSRFNYTFPPYSLTVLRLKQEN